MVKATRPDAFFGYGFAFGSNIPGATPGEYLDRITLQNEIFDDDIRLEAVVPVGTKLSVVTSQPFVAGSDSTQGEIDSTMIEKGFEKFRDGRNYLCDQGLLISDLFPKNSKTDKERVVHPIDPMIQRVTKEFGEFMRIYDRD